MKVLIVNTLPVPSGQASVNRILSLGKGLVEIGDEVTILSASKGKDTELHNINGIQYVNLVNKKSKVPGLIESLIKILIYIKYHKSDINVVWVVSNSPLLILPLWFSCKLHKIKYIIEKSEFPFVLMQQGVFAKLWAKIYVNTIYKLFDGMIIMTQPLFDYFQNLVRKDCVLVKIPMTVDISRFDNVEENNQYGDYAAYCGNMSGNKDGVENLLEAFAYVEPIHPDFKLVMIGDADTKEEFDFIREKSNSLKLKNVIFAGRVSRDTIPMLLMHAKILCLARPTSLQSTGGFPTKLGEYLATGNPVVVTSVGEIPNYLNIENSYIIEPDDNKLFGETINNILMNYDEAVQVGLNGRKVALHNFNYAIQAQRLHVFLINILDGSHKS